MSIGVDLYNQATGKHVLSVTEVVQEYLESVIEECTIAAGKGKTSVQIYAANYPRIIEQEVYDKLRIKLHIEDILLSKPKGIGFLGSKSNLYFDVSFD